MTISKHHRALLAVLRGCQDQDMELAKRWWRESSDDDKAEVWSAIQDDDTLPVMEQIIRRFAQVGMTEVALRSEEKP